MRNIIRDLIVDIRCAGRDNQPKYKEECIEHLKICLKNRNKPGSLDKYGWPKCLKGE